MQHILKRGKPHERSQIINKLVGRVVQLSQHKFASNVVEKCLVYGNTTEQELLIDEILDHSDENDNLLVCQTLQQKLTMDFIKSRFEFIFLRADFVACSKI